LHDAIDLTGNIGVGDGVPHSEINSVKSEIIRALNFGKDLFLRSYQSKSEKRGKY